MKKQIYILSTIIILFGYLLSQAEYQILYLPKNPLELASTNKLQNIQNKKYDYSFSFIKYPSDITLYNTNYKNFEFTILDYGQFEDSLNDVVNNTFYANEILFNYHYNKKLDHIGSLKISSGGFYSKIDSYSSYGVTNNVYLLNKLNNFNYSIGIENIGKILSSYTNHNLKLPMQYRMHLSYNFNKNSSSFGVKLNYDAAYFKNYQDLNHIICLIFSSKKNNIDFYISNSNYSKKLAIQNDNSKLFSGIALGTSINLNKLILNIAIKNLGAAGIVSGFSLNYKLS